MEFPQGWYAAISSNEVVSGKPTAVRRFGQDLVAWRDGNGNPVVMEDMCPHRSVKLSLGTVKDGTITCAFHGFEFGSDGGCLLVPETAKPAPNLRCRTARSSESHGFIWLWHGADEDATPTPPWFDELNDKLAWSQYQSSWPCHITRCIENQLDYAHLPYVHATTIGGGFNISDPDLSFELDENVIKLQMGTGHFMFKFPNIWSLQILANRFYQFIAFVPIDNEQTLLYVRAYQQFVTFPGVRELVGLILDIQSRKILGQDQRVVLSHPRHSSILDTGEKHYPSDKGIAWFRKLWSEKTAK